MDGDGVNNDEDLDDVGDGILDTDEDGGLGVITRFLVWILRVLLNQV